jgi:hypothetical protein
MARSKRRVEAADRAVLYLSSAAKATAICGELRRRLMAEQFEEDAIQARDCCVAKNATHRAARPDPSLRRLHLIKAGLLRMTNEV